MAETTLNKNQAGSGIWTEDSLIAGDNISITQIPQALIDENTVELLHFDNNTIDTITNTDVLSSSPASSYISYSDSMNNFGKCVLTTQQTSFTSNLSIDPYTSSCTIDFWVKPNNQSGFCGVCVTSDTLAGRIGFDSYNSLYIGADVAGDALSWVWSVPSNIGKWSHLAFVNDITNSKSYIFLNGNLLGSWTRSLRKNPIIGLSTILTTSFVDEFRISNVARWTSNFNPYIIPYQQSGAPEKYEINSDLSSCLTSDSVMAGNNISIYREGSKANYSVVGSPNISDGVASGFSDNDYLLCDNYINNASSSFEVVTAVKMTTASTTNQGLFDTQGVNTHNIRFSISPTNTVRLRISTDGGETYAVDITGTTPLTIGTKFYIKATYNSSTGYALYTSTDGSTWNTEGTSSVTTRPYSNAYHLIRIGDNVAIGSSLTGSIYLSDSYINVNGYRVWTAYTHSGPITVNVDLTTATGYDATKTQVLKNVNGTLTWVDEA